jgi:predicted kinase
MQTLYIIRGLPGSGKTTLAKEIMTEHPETDFAHYEADMYFTDAAGNYIWDYRDIAAAHEWCYRGVEDALFNGYDVIVSNTFVEMRSMEQYFVLGERLECKIVVIECLGQYGSIHNVPEATLEKMRSKWVPNSRILNSKYEYRTIV